MGQEGSAPLAGRIALVTGASRGIGAAIAVRLAELGAQVAVSARTLDEVPDAALAGSLRSTAARIESVGGRACTVVADLADPDDRARIVERATDALGPIDILVNNAAAAIYAPISDMPLRRRRLLAELNLHAPVDLVQAVVPGMRELGRGAIVNISSRTSEPEDGPPYAHGVMGTSTVLYGSTKAALERVTVGLAAELYEDDIAVNSLAPVAAVRTEGAAALLGDRVGAESFEPLWHMAEAAAHLAGCTASTRTGQVLYSGPLLRELGLLTD